MSIKYNDKTNSQEVLLAGIPATDQILSPTSKNPIANKTVYNALSAKVDKTVSDLVNYYNKTDVYNKAEVRELIGSINTLTMEVVNALPVSDISSTTIYLLKQSGVNVYDEYVYINNAWVKIGTTEMDLSDYVTTSQLSLAIADFLTETQINTLLAAKQDKQLTSQVTIGSQTIGTVEDAIDEIAGIVPTLASSSNQLAIKSDILPVDSALSDSSTNPVQNKVVKAAVDDKANQSEVNDILNVYASKNLLPSLTSTYTWNEVTYTPQSDGSIVVTGTASPDTSLAMLTTTTVLPAGSYVVSSGVTMTNPIELVIDDTNNNRLATVNSGNYRNFTIDSDTTIKCYIWIYKGTDAGGIRIYPMIRKVSIADDTYVPYAKTNKELTEELTVEAGDITRLVSFSAVTAYGLRKYGKVVELYFAGTLSEAVNTWTDFLTVPEGFRPSHYVQIVSFNTYSSCKNLQLAPSGGIQSGANLTSGEFIRFTATYIIN